MDFTFISLSLLLNFLFSKGWKIAIVHSLTALQLWFFILNASHPTKKGKGKKSSQHLAGEWSYICSRETGSWPRTLLGLAFVSISGQSPWIHFSILFLFHLTKPLHYGYKNGKDTALILTRFRFLRVTDQCKWFPGITSFPYTFKKGHFQ